MFLRKKSNRIGVDGLSSAKSLGFAHVEQRQELDNNKESNKQVKEQEEQEWSRLQAMRISSPQQTPEHEDEVEAEEEGDDDESEGSNREESEESEEDLEDVDEIDLQDQEDEEGEELKTVEINAKEMEEFSILEKPQASKPKEQEWAVSGVPLALLHPFGHGETVWFEYPSWLNLKRDTSKQAVEEVPESRRSGLLWTSYWERNCLKDVLQQAGFQGGKETSKKTSVNKKHKLIWSKHLKTWGELKKSQRHNHFPGSRCIGRKDRLALTISKKVRSHGDIFKILPESFVLPMHSERLRQRLKKCSGKESWIRKPLASSQGRGIKVLGHDAVSRLVSASTKPSASCKKNGKAAGTTTKTAKSPATKGCVIQRYVDRPLLINGYKFDVRVYVAVTSFNPLRVYMFPEGLARFCTVKYSRKHRKDQFRHLTNYSINKKSELFQHNVSAEEDSVGSKWSLSALFRYMDEQYGTSVREKIQTDMETVIVKTLIAADDDINSKMNAQVRNPDSCFELFGFDLMLDRNLRVWLVEVNISPSLMTASPLDKKVKTIMICDTLHLVGVPVNNKPLKARCDASTISKRSAGSKQHQHQQHAAKVVPTKRGKNALTVAKKTWSALPADDKQVVEQVAAENLRRGHFKRIFPPQNDPALHQKYLDLFTAPRYNNVLVYHFERDAIASLP